MAKPTIPRPSTLYSYIRGRQLEGTYPGSRTTGIWSITGYRVLRGWGIVTEADWPISPETLTWPPDEPPGLDKKAKAARILYYRRVRSIPECLQAISKSLLPSAAFQITEQWYDAKHGFIRIPPPGTPIVGSHQVTLTGYYGKSRLLKFRNSWGDWGDSGFGTMPFEFFERWMFDAWVIVGPRHQIPYVKGPGIQQVSWNRVDPAGQLVHGFDIYDNDCDERLGWAFATRRKPFVDVEEWYVRPGWRRRGYGRTLLGMLQDFSSKVKWPLRFWIPLADCGDNNLEVVTHLLAQSGYRLEASGVRWAAYRGVRGSVEGYSRPAITFLPDRPASMRRKAEAAVLTAASIFPLAGAYPHVELSPADKTTPGFVSSAPIARGTDAPVPQNDSSQKPTTDELLEPFRRQVSESGITDDELDAFFEELRDKVWEEKQGKEDQGQ